MTGRSSRDAQKNNDSISRRRRYNTNCPAKLDTARTCLFVGVDADGAGVLEVHYMAGSKPSVHGDGQIGLSSTQFLTVAEVANLMRVSKMTVYRLVHGGELPAVRVGRSFRVHAKAVHDYLETSYFDAG